MARACRPKSNRRSHRWRLGALHLSEDASKWQTASVHADFAFVSRGFVTSSRSLLNKAAALGRPFQIAPARPPSLLSLIERNLKDGRHLSKHPLVFLHAHFQVNDVDHRKMKSSRSVTIQRIRGGGFVFCGSSGERSIADGLARLDRGNFRFHPVGLFFFFLSDARFTEQMCDFNSPPPLPHPKMRLHSRRFRYHTFG